MGIFILLLIIIGFGAFGYFILTSIFDLFIGSNKEPKTSTYIDNSVHYHQHLTIVKKDETITETRTEIKY
ncbi:hypothetical protein [Maribacter sp. Hel_I_7]|uniref:hypothetical protein n=1 Tax=Maribacter sp. Hel_I_7 TaxID=1249997 RepID=UPI00047E1AB9|nr:hypothetical protein [Maribacter sp. Hel_I_7]